MIKVGNKAIDKIKLGSKKINKVYLGNKIIWENNDNDGNDRNAYRFVRIQWSVDGAIHINEIQAFVDNVNVSQGTTVTPVALPGGGNGNALVDGNLTVNVMITHWARPTNVTVDLGQLQPLTHVIVTRAANGGGGNIIIDVSEDNVNWVRASGDGQGNTPRFEIG